MNYKQCLKCAFYFVFKKVQRLKRSNKKGLKKLKAQKDIE